MVTTTVCDLRLKLVEDLPGKHVYVHCCGRCHREVGPEFLLYHASNGKESEPVPFVDRGVCGGHADSGLCVSLVRSVADIDLAGAHV